MIELVNLTKRFGDFTAVDHLSLTIETGEFFGLLGPNGAGKTTTISMMSTVLLPSEGEIRVDGARLDRRSVIDEAPTYARILGVEMPEAEGKAIEEILRVEEN